MNDFSLDKKQRLYSRKEIGFLFENGQSIFSYPIKAVYTLNDTTEKASVKAAFSVSKRNFKLAVDRNRFKRLMRESYRLNKQLLADTKQSNLSVMFIYATKEQLDFHTVEANMIKLLKRLHRKINETGG